MRRALLLAVLAPALAARAQTTGQITFTPTAIGVAGCDPANAQTLTLAFTPQLASGVTLSGGIYRVFATDTAPTTATNGISVCKTASDTSSHAAQIGPDVTATTTTPQSIDVNASDVVAASGATCAQTTDKTIYVCVHYLPTGTTVPVGSATGTIIFSVQKPAKPTGVVVEPADGALVVSWSAPSNATEYVVHADPVTAGADVSHETGRVTSTSDQRIAGLVNGVTYDVTVVAYSAGGNASDPSDPVPGTPQPVDDFWDRYRAAGGREQGGCASGPAGLLGMLLAAAALARAGRKA